MRILLLPHLFRKGTHMRENEKRKTRDEEKNETLIGAGFYATHSVFILICCSKISNTTTTSSSSSSSSNFGWEGLAEPVVIFGRVVSHEHVIKNMPIKQTIIATKLITQFETTV